MTYTQPPPYAYPPAAPARRRRRPVLAIVSIVAAGLVTAAVGATVILFALAKPNQGPLTVIGLGDLHVRGTLTLPMGAHDAIDVGTCAGTGRFTDIREGTAVIVADAAGKTIGMGQLQVGRRQFDKTCLFSFEVDAPAGEDYYTVAVAGRGAIRYTEADILDGIRIGLG